MIVLETEIIGSKDLKSAAGITVGFDDNNDFLVELQFSNYVNENESYRKRATLSSRDAYRISERLKIKATALPEYIYRTYGEKAEASSPADIKNIYSQILDYITSSGCRYRMMNLPGKTGR